jgi:transposase
MWVGHGSCNPELLGSETAFAHLCRAAPKLASSGTVVRHRLNPDGNRDAYRTLHVVVLNLATVSPSAILAP